VKGGPALEGSVRRRYGTVRSRGGAHCGGRSPRVRSAAVLGIDGYLVDVETDIASGLPTCPVLAEAHLCANVLACSINPVVSPTSAGGAA
jgi:hypothetical protein